MGAIVLLLLIAFPLGWKVLGCCKAPEMGENDAVTIASLPSELEQPESSPDSPPDIVPSGARPVRGPTIQMVPSNRKDPPPARIINDETVARELQREFMTPTLFKPDTADRVK